MTIKQTARWTALGIPFGLAGSYAAARSLRALLFGIEPLDPFTLVLAALLLTSVATIATWIPARRAARVHPAEVLTFE